MLKAPSFAWHAVEYDFEEKSAEWYWALGIITVAVVVASLLFGNYLLAAVFASAAFAIGVQTAKEPKEHFFQLSEKGLSIGNRLYPFSIMHSFSMFEHIDGDKPPLLSIKTHSLFSPHLIVPLDENINADMMYAFLFAYIDEGEHEVTLADHIAGWLGL